MEMRFIERPRSLVRNVHYLGLMPNEGKEEVTTMKLNSRIVTMATLVAGFAAASLAQQVKTDYDRSANFGQYKTYSWQSVRTSDPLMIDRIKSAINAALVAKGWAEVPSGGNTALVAIETTRDQQTLDTFYDGFGGGWRWRGFGGFGEATTTTETYKVGTLVVDIFDANSKNLIWRGSASDTLSNNSDKNIKELDKSVSKMFKGFSPTGGKK